MNWKRLYSFPSHGLSSVLPSCRHRKLKTKHTGKLTYCRITDWIIADLILKIGLRVAEISTLKLLKTYPKVATAFPSWYRPKELPDVKSKLTSALPRYRLSNCWRPTLEMCSRFLINIASNNCRLSNQNSPPRFLVIDFQIIESWPTFTSSLPRYRLYNCWIPNRKSLPHFLVNIAPNNCLMSNLDLRVSLLSTFQLSRANQR